MASLTPLSHNLSSLSRMWTLLSSKECLFSLRCRCTAVYWPEEVALMLRHALVELLFGLSYVEVRTLFAALHTQHHSVFVWVFGPLGEPVSRLRVFLGLKYTGMSCLEKILLSFWDSCHIWNYSMFVSVLLSFSTSVVWSRCLCWFDKGPAWVSTGLKNFLGVLIFLLFSLSLRRYTLSPPM